MTGTDVNEAFTQKSSFYDPVLSLGERMGERYTIPIKSFKGDIGDIENDNAEYSA